LTQLWLIVVADILILLFVVGFCSCCVGNHALSSIPWWIM
jgi:hypothetical protein